MKFDELFSALFELAAVASASSYHLRHVLPSYFKLRDRGQADSPCIPRIKQSIVGVTVYVPALPTVFIASNRSPWQAAGPLGARGQLHAGPPRGLRMGVHLLVGVADIHPASDVAGLEVRPPRHPARPDRAHYRSALPVGLHQGRREEGRQQERRPPGQSSRLQVRSSAGACPFGRVVLQYAQ